MKKIILVFSLLSLLPINAFAISQQAQQNAIEHHRRLIQRYKQRDDAQETKNSQEKSHKNREDLSLKRIWKKVENYTARDNAMIDLSFDNSGNKLTGERIDTIGYSQNNLLFKNDSFGISRSSNDFDKTRDKIGGNDTIVANFSVPISSYNLSLSYVKSSYFFWDRDFDTTSFKVSGISESKNVNLSHNFIKNSKYKLDGNIGISGDSARLFIDNSKNSSGSRRASVGSIDFTNTFFFKDSTLILAPRYNKSLALFNAQKDATNLSSTDPHAEFHSFSLSGSFMHNFKIADIGSFYNLSFNGQASDKALYGADQISAGGLYSVRGFKEGAISGDSGYNVRNELTLDVGQKLVSVIDSKKDSWLLNNLRKLSIAPFYDYGYVRSKGGQQSGRLSGTGTRFDYAGQNLTASLTLSWALSKSQYLAQHHGENSAVFFNISSQFGL